MSLVMLEASIHAMTTALSYKIYAVMHSAEKDTYIVTNCTRA